MSAMSDTIVRDTIIEPVLVRNNTVLDLESIPSGFAYSTIYYILISGIVIFVLFKFLNFILPVWAKSQKSKKVVFRFLPIIQLLVWTIYFVLAINHIWVSNLFFGIGFFLIFMVLAVWVSWYAFRDFIAGTIFKFNNHFNNNESIRYGDIHGRVIKQGARYIILENEHGEQTYIPYSKLTGEVIIKTHPAENILHHRFRIDLPNYLDADHTMTEIKNSIMKLPWVSIKKEPNVKIIQMDDQLTTFEITIFSPDQRYFYLIEENIRNKFEEINNS